MPEPMVLVQIAALPVIAGLLWWCARMVVVEPLRDIREYTRRAAEEAARFNDEEGIDD